MLAHEAVAQWAGWLSTPTPTGQFHSYYFSIYSTEIKQITTVTSERELVLLSLKEFVIYTKVQWLTWNLTVST